MKQCDKYIDQVDAQENMSVYIIENNYYLHSSGK